MRTAEDIVEDYRGRGYSNDRIRALANGRPEPMRSAILALLAEAIEEDASAETTVENVPEETAMNDPETKTLDPGTYLPEDVDKARVEADEVEVAEIEVEMLKEQIASLAETARAEQKKSAAVSESAEETVAVAAEPVRIHEAVAEPVDEADDAAASAALIEAAYDRSGETLESTESESLAPLSAERLTAEEYEARGGEAGEEPEVIDLRELDEALAHGEHLGEWWPPVDAGEEEHETVDMKEPPKALHRTLKVLRNTLGAETMADDEDTNVIAFAPPYAVEGCVEADNVNMGQEDSSYYILFPAEMQAEYDAVVASRGSALVAARVNGAEDDMVEPEAVDIPASDLEALPAHATQASIDELLEELDENRKPHPLASRADVESFVDQAAAEDHAETLAASNRELAQRLSEIERWNRQLEEALELKALELDQMATALADKGVEASVLRERLTETAAVVASEGSPEEDALRAELAGMEKALATKDAMLAELREAIARGNAEFAETGADIDAELDAARAQLDDLHQRHAELQREFNILSTDTVPALMKDKEDLVDMLEDHATRERNLQQALAGSGRRTGYAVTVAAAMSLLVVMLPALHWMNGTPAATTPRQDPVLVARLEQSHEVRETLEEENVALTRQLETLRKDARLAEIQYQDKLDRLRDSLGAMEHQLARLQQQRQTRDTPAMGGGVDLDHETGDHLAGGLHYNDVQGTDAWRRRREETHGRRWDTPRTTRVQHGEGLSQVLWREFGQSNKALLKWVTEVNKLALDGRGNPILHPDQMLILPKDPNNVALAETE